MRPPRLCVPSNSTVRAEDLLLLDGQLRPFAVSSAGIDAFRPAPFSGPSSRSCLPFEPGSSRVQTQIRPMMRRFRVPFASFVTCGDGWCNSLHVHRHGVVLCCVVLCIGPLCYPLRQLLPVLVALVQLERHLQWRRMVEGILARYKRTVRRAWKIGSKANARTAARANP